MRGVVAQQLERVVAGGRDDLQTRAVGQRRCEVLQLAVDLHRERRAREAGADRGGRVGAGRAVVELQSGAVWEQGLHREEAC